LELAPWFKGNSRRSVLWIGCRLLASCLLPTRENTTRKKSQPDFKSAGGWLETTWACVIGYLLHPTFIILQFFDNIYAHIKWKSFRL
jgi:hypothetical protein